MCRRRLNTLGAVVGAVVVRTEVRVLFISGHFSLVVTDAWRRCVRRFHGLLVVGRKIDEAGRGTSRATLGPAGPR